MGWGSGSELAESIWNVVRPLTTPKNRKKVAKKLVDFFEEKDCDTMHECEQLMKDAGLENRDDD